jgi:GNAT superfamily N-acetyltransferase
MAYAHGVGVLRQHNAKLVEQPANAVDYYHGTSMPRGFTAVHLDAGVPFIRQALQLRAVMSTDAVQLIDVSSPATREAARALLREYLQWINETAAENYGLSFDVEAMLASDIGDESKFYPPAGRFYLVCYRGAYVGVGCLKALEPTVGEIQRMYVQPGARGLGAARSLVERLVADARHLGYTTIRLESLKVLTEAHTLYRSIGFVDIDRYGKNSMREYHAVSAGDRYRSSALFMELRL